MSSSGSPFTDQPPTTVTVSDVTQQEVDPRNRAKLEALGRKDAGDFNTMWAARMAHITDAPGTVASIIIGILDLIMASMTKVLTAAQGEKNSGFYDLAAAVVQDLTGVAVDAEQLKQSTFGSGRLAGMETLGGDLYDTLQSEFEPASGDLETGDDAPAKKFLGFLMNFAIRQGNVETILSLIPEEYRFLDGIRGYGELMAKNLGLGRMARRALQPLMQILVADPLMYKLQNDFRPKRIGAMPAIRKFFRDPTFETQMRKELGQEGYTDDRIDDLIAELRPLLSEHQLIQSLFRFGNVTSSIGSTSTVSITDLLAQRGYSADDVTRFINVSRPIATKEEIVLLFNGGIMDKPTALTYMEKLGYDDDEANLVLQAHAIAHQHAHRLGLGELKKAFHENVIDLLTLKAHLTTAGYSDDDIQIITLDLLQPTVGKVRQLSLAEIKAAVKAGALTIEQATSHLKGLGFSDSDIATLEATFPVPAPAATATTPTSTAPTTPTAG
jgi:hypothetical protein